MKKGLGNIVSRLTFSNVVAVVALFIALGGASYAAIKIPKNSVGAKQLKKNAITSKKVKDRSLLAADFKVGQIPPGATGAQGPIGLRGIPGVTGSTGANGPAGPDGVTGPAGLNGVTGPAGLNGATGPTGIKGATGSTGVAGSPAFAIVSGRVALPNINRFFSIDGAIVSANESDTEFLSPAVDVTASNLRVEMVPAPGVGNNRGFTLRVNQASTTLFCGITGAATTCSDTTHDVTIPAGSDIDFFSVNGAAPASVAKFGFTIGQ